MAKGSFEIKNKIKRNEVYHRKKAEKKILKQKYNLKTSCINILLLNKRFSLVILEFDFKLSLYVNPDALFTKNHKN